MKVSVREYANKEGVSVQTIYNRIKSGKLDTEETVDGVYIILSDEESTADTIGDSQAVLLERIKQLEERLKTAERDKEDLKKQVEQSNILQLKALETVKALEHKTEVIEEELIQEKNKTWLQKLFKK